MYDKDRLRTNFFLATGGLLVLSLLFYLLALYQHSMREKRQRSLVPKPRRIFNSKSSNSRTRQKSESRNCRFDNHDKQLPKNPQYYCFKDNNHNDYVTDENKKLVVSSALQQPFKIAISLSAPVLANQTKDDGGFCMAPPTFPDDDDMQATAV